MLNEEYEMEPTINAEKKPSKVIEMSRDDLFQEENAFFDLGLYGIRKEGERNCVNLPAELERRNVLKAMWIAGVLKDEQLRGIKEPDRRMMVSEFMELRVSIIGMSESNKITKHGYKYLVELFKKYETPESDDYLVGCNSLDWIDGYMAGLEDGKGISKKTVSTPSAFDRLGQSELQDPTCL